MVVEAFLLLLGGHFLADYVLQTDTIATGKNKNIDPSKFGVDWWYWLTAHSVTHGAFVYMITGSVWLGLAETALHWLIDYGKCQKWYGLHVDQTLHIICKGLWAVI